MILINLICKLETKLIRTRFVELDLNWRAFDVVRLHVDTSSGLLSSGFGGVSFVHEVLRCCS